MAAPLTGRSEAQVLLQLVYWGGLKANTIVIRTQCRARARITGAV